MTVQEILAKGFERPADFRAALIKQAEMHDDYARLARDPLAHRGAINQRDACLKLYDIAGNDASMEHKIAAVMPSPSGTAPTIGLMVVGVNAAAKLCDIPSHVRTAAVVAWEEGRQS